MRFLICGMGSIGKRHMENLESLGSTCEDIIIFRTRKGTTNFGDKILENHGGRHIVFNDLKKALAEKPDVAFITNPTSLHVPVALEAARAGCHLFIEKPLSGSTKGVYALIKEVDSQGTIAFIAQNRRFHPLFKQVKQWLKEEITGKLISVNAEMAERITDWHPWEDFKTGYSARSDLGGGVVSAQCHELDYLYSLFGKPKWIFAAGGELGGLGIGVEDTCKSLMEFENGIIASLHIDYLKRPKRGFLEITGTKGRIYWDYFNRTLEFIPIEGTAKLIRDSDSQPDNGWMASSFINELRSFLLCIENKNQIFPDLKQGNDVLNMILATKKSLKTKKIIYL